MRPSPAARTTLAFALRIVLTIGSGLALAQETTVPPERTPQGSRFGIAPVRLDAQPLSLPVGFGVPLTPSMPPSPAAQQTALGAPDAAGMHGAVVLEADPAPPSRLPAGAQLGTSPLSAFQISDVPLGRVRELPGPTVGDVAGFAVREEGRRLRFTLSADVLFDFDRSNLRSEAGPVLRRLLEQVRDRMPRAAYTVEGHTDAIGTDAYNVRLSTRRADAVKAWLVREGSVPSGTVATAGFGKMRPVASNVRPDGSDDPEGRQKNRRVEIVVTPLS